jgi:hypothetical protein
MASSPFFLLDPRSGQTPAVIAGEHQVSAAAAQAGNIAMKDDLTKGMNRP